MLQQAQLLLVIGPQVSSHAGGRPTPLRRHLCRAPKIALAAIGLGQAALKDLSRQAAGTMVIMQHGKARAGHGLFGNGNDDRCGTGTLHQRVALVIVFNGAAGKKRYHPFL